uniref:Uncharacterized protein n=1 Tax=Picea glauca TaxID=3330 RepID=A0A101M3X6_PICGL|nr:hypothetical protein ABT39_MTgene270 [Picea glauca]
MHMGNTFLVFLASAMSWATFHRPRVKGVRKGKGKLGESRLEREVSSIKCPLSDS